MRIEPDQDRRDQSDRRQAPGGLWGLFHWGGHRERNRRSSEQHHDYLVDRYSVLTLALIVLLLAFSMVDAVITLDLLGADHEEINPVMKHLLNKGLLPFLLGKYVLTAAGLPLLLIFKNYFLFGTRFRVGYLIPAFVAAYVVLLGYQFLLLQARADIPSIGPTVAEW